MYESESKVVEPWVDSPGEVSREDWRDYLGRREYVRFSSALFEFNVLIYIIGTNGHL